MSPAYVCKQSALKRNLSILNELQNDQVSVFLALKGFAFSKALKDVFSILKGASASGLWEALLAAEYEAKHICTFSPAFKAQELAACIGISNSLITNSLAQFQSAINTNLSAQELALNEVIASQNLNQNFARSLFERLKQPCSFGLRVNPASSFAPRAIYNPCARFSRLGVRKEDFAKALADKAFVPDGLHLHALCEEDFSALEIVFNAFDEQFLTPLYKSGRELKFINLGGGHHITRKDYDVAALKLFANELAARTKAKIIFEPGEAVGWQVGVLRASVVDIIKNELNIAILDISAEAHMPDTIIMPYTSEVSGAKIAASKDELDKLQDKPNLFILAANTCLAGDICGAYEFAKPLQIGDVVEFCDQIHYSIVKNTTFNGVMLPDLVYEKEDGSLETSTFTYSAYKDRN